MRERRVRAHALRPNDQVYYDGKWWVVVKPLEENEIIKWTDKSGERNGVAPERIPESCVCLLLMRGSQRKQLFGSRIALVRILRG